MFYPLSLMTPKLRDRMRSSPVFPIYAAVYSWVGRRLGSGLYPIQGGPAKGLRIWVEPHLRRGYLAGLYEPDVTRAIEAHCSAGMTTIDIGAHRGYFTLIMSRIVGPEGRCIAFEPEPDNARFLRTTIAANHLTNVRVEQLAIGAASGTVAFRGHELSTMGRLDALVGESSRHAFGDYVMVEATTLDAYATSLPLDRLDFAKVDVEGAERMVIDGASETLRRFRPTLLIEVHDFERAEAHARTLVTMLRELDYAVNDVASGSEVDPATYQGGTILAIPGQPA